MMDWQKCFIPVIVLAGFVSYINVYDNQFLWDDEFAVQKNAYIRDFSRLPEIFTTSSGTGAGRIDNFYRPVQLLMYSIAYSFSGMNPFGYHLLNVLLHLANAVLLFLLVSGVFGEKRAAFLASLLWVVHPVHTEAVTYMNGTADPLSMFFALSSFLLYMRFRDRKKPAFLALSMASFVMALMSKETIIILPALLALYELTRHNLNFKQYKWIAPFFALSVIYFALRLTVLNFGGTLNFYGTENLYTQNLSVRILTFLASLLSYYSFLLLPINLHMERQFPVFTSLLSAEVAASVLIILALSFFAYRSIRQQKFYHAFGVLWFFISFIPMSGIIPVNALLLEHWLYLPSAGFFVVTAFLVFHAWEKHTHYRKLISAFLVLIVLASAGLALNRNADWKDPITFYNNILRYNNGTARVHNNLAMAYADKGNVAAAEGHYLKAIEISDTYPQTRYNLARLYVENGELDKSILHLKKSIEIDRNFFFSYQLLAAVYYKLGEIKKAEEYAAAGQDIGYYYG